MSKNNKLQRIQEKALLAAVGFFLVFIASLIYILVDLYLDRFGLCLWDEPAPNTSNGSFSWSCIFKNDISVWGQTGDFFGGLINPLIGLVTVLLIILSYWQNRLVLNESRLAFDFQTNSHVKEVTERRFLQAVETLGKIASKEIGYNEYPGKPITMTLFTACKTYNNNYSKYPSETSTEKRIFNFKKEMTNLVPLISQIKYLYNKHDDEETKFMFSAFLLSATSPDFVASVALFVLDTSKAASDYEERKNIALTFKDCLRHSGNKALVDLISKNIE